MKEFSSRQESTKSWAPTPTLRGNWNCESGESRVNHCEDRGKEGTEMWKKANAGKELGKGGMSFAHERQEIFLPKGGLPEIRCG